MSHLTNEGQDPHGAYQLDNQSTLPVTFIGPQGLLQELANVQYSAGSDPYGNFAEYATIHSTYIDAELVNAKINFGEPYMGIVYSNEAGVSTVANGISVSPDGNSLSVSGNLTVAGDLNVVGSNNVIISDPILELGNQATMEQNTGVIMSRPMDEGNVGMVYITDQFSEYDNTLVFGYHNGWAGQDDIRPNVEANITVEVLGNLVAANYYGNAASMISLTGLAAGTYGNSNVSNGSANLIAINVDANGYISNVTNLVVQVGSSNLQEVTDVGNITTNTVIFANTENSFVTYGTAGIMNVDSHHTLALGNESHTGNLYISGNISIDTDGSIVRIGAGAASAVDAELTSPLAGMISLGTRAGGEYQNSNAVAIGLDAGFQSQNANAVAIGTEAGQYFQGIDAISVGVEAGRYSQNARSLAVGTQAGLAQQGADAVAMGYRAGKHRQENEAFAVGVRAGESNQGSRAMAMGVRAGSDNQGEGAVAVGFSAGRVEQDADSVAIGTFAGRTSQGSASVAIGYDAGRSNQSANAVAIGFGAGNVAQGANSVAIGYQAATTSQHANTVVINATGQPLETQTTDAIYLAPIRFNPVQVSRLLTSNADTGELVQANVMVSNANVGVNLTDVLDITEALSVGGNVKADYFLGNANTLVSTTDVGDGVYGYVDVESNGYGSNLLSISVVDGRISEVYNTFVPSTNLTLQQVTDWGNITTNTVVLSNTEISLLTRGNVAVGTANAEPLHSLEVGQDQYFEGDILIGGGSSNTVVGCDAGSQSGTFGINRVAVGVEAGKQNQGSHATAVGRKAGRSGQSDYAVAVGSESATANQGSSAIAVGSEAGRVDQNAHAIAIGASAGRNSQGSYSIAMGRLAGREQHDKTVILNASGALLNSQQDGSFYVSPVRNEAVKTSNLVTYENSNGEVTVSNLIYENGNLSVGNTTAQYEVDVLGNIHFSQNIYGNGLFLNTTTDLPDGTYSHGESNEYGSNTMSLTIVNGRLSSVGNSFVSSGGLGTVSNIGNAASNVVQFINTETSFVTLGNVGISNGLVEVVGAHLVVGQDDTPYTSNMIHLSGNTRITQEGNIVSIGTNSLDLEDGAVAVGWDAGGGGDRTVAVGFRAGAGTTGDVGNRVAIGYEAAQANQKKNAIAVGYVAGRETQGVSAIAVGVNAGRTSQGQWAIGVGQDAGRLTQNTGAVAVGFGAGRTSQGEHAIAIGRDAGYNEQANNSIILNASGAALNGGSANAFYVSNIRQEDSNGFYYTGFHHESNEVVRGGVWELEGNVGLGGNVAPDHELAVNGNGWFSDNIYAGNLITGGTLDFPNYRVIEDDPLFMRITDPTGGVQYMNIHAPQQNVTVSSNLTVNNTLVAQNVVANASMMKSTTNVSDGLHGASGNVIESITILDGRITSITNVDVVTQLEMNSTTSDILFTTDGVSINGTSGNLTYDTETNNLFGVGNVELLGNIEVGANIYGNLVTNVIWFDGGGGGAVTNKGLDFQNVINRGNTFSANTIIASGFQPALISNGNVTVGQTVPGPSNLYVAGNVGISQNLNVTQNIYVGGDIDLGDGAILTTSDFRIKENIAAFDGDKPFRKLRHLSPKSFNFIGSSRTEVGFVAQELEKVLPETVSRKNGVLPNIRSNAVTQGRNVVMDRFRTSALLSDNTTPRVLVSTLDRGHVMTNVVEVVNSTTLKVDEDFTQGANVFVVGQEVTDFRQINKDDIYMISSAAVVQLDRVVSKQKMEIRDLQKRLANIEKKLSL